MKQAWYQIIYFRKIEQSIPSSKTLSLSSLLNLSNVPPQNILVDRVPNNTTRALRPEQITRRISNASLDTIHIFIAGDLSLFKSVFAHPSASLQTKVKKENYLSRHKTFDSLRRTSGMRLRSTARWSRSTVSTTISPFAPWDSALSGP